jgi:hypothetical protein
MLATIKTPKARSEFEPNPDPEGPDFSRAEKSCREAASALPKAEA